MDTPFFFILIVGGGLLVLITIGMILTRLYRRASKEISFVRTGLGGERVIMNGGSLVLPVLHEIIPVNMNTQRLEVLRHNEEALITKDRMRVDVRAEFYVRVKPTAESIANAAQTLGRRTTDPQALKELVEGKFVDALRAVAAEMAMEELHEKRVDFVQKVQTAVMEDLLKNGLELESVSLTSLDQTDQKFFNPHNAFDAQGLTKLTEEIEERKKQRNVIERDTEVAIQQKNLEAERLTLELTKEQEYARLAQQREIAVRRAEEAATTARQEAEKQRESEEARIIAKQRVDQAGILATRLVEEERIEKDRLLQEREIVKKRVLETAEIDRRRTIELADQDRAIVIAQKSQEQSVAQTEADNARALAVAAEERVSTARQTEIAERQKAIELVEARKEAERAAITIAVAAETDRKAAEDKASALRTLAAAEADKVRIAAEADEKKYAVDAEGQRALHEAENVLSPQMIALRVKLAIIEHLDQIIRESVKPIEAIKDIKIIQVDGLNTGGVGANGAGSAAASPGTPTSGNLADQVVTSALRYRAQAPLVDALLKEIGMIGSDLNALAAEARTDRLADAEKE